MKAPAVIAKVNALAAGLVALPWTMSSATAAIASGFRQSKGDSAFNSQYLHILPVEIITKGQIAKIDIDQELQIVNVILLQVFLHPEA